uniref:probable ATP-dependent RNA helicase DHX58 n=1 Tax=Styela clava TaxID=7725 RepID=UPI00193AC99D|nr:probable ATP-dependent RNA helicase DHX58 [Styela clava]
MIKVGEYKAIQREKKPLASGNFSKVYKGRFDDKDVIVKRLDRTDDDDDDMILNYYEELELHRSLQHENVVKYLYKDIEVEYIYIVLEKCECTLREFVIDKKYEVPHLSMLWQSTSGLAYLHGQNIIHRDLKPSNILLTQQDGKWIAKITDFGISKKISPDKTKLTLTSIKGTLGYSSPEALNEDKITKGSDIYSMGVIFYYVLSKGDHPHGSDNLKVESKIRDGEEPNIENMDAEYMHDARSLVLAMLSHKYYDRPKVDEVQAHHLFWDPEKKFSFIQDVSDYSIADGKFDEMSPLLEKNSQEVIGESWRDTLYAVSSVVKETFEKMKNKKQKDGVFDLLRTIRNLKHHYHEKSDEFKQAVGEIPDGLMEFFTSLYPKLLSHTYDAVKSKRQEYNFAKYYTFTENSGINSQRSPSRPSTEEEIKQDSVPDAKPEDSNNTNVKEVVHNENPKLEKSSNCEKPEKLVLRNYQKELAEQALQGNNSLIVAPTGSGKTAVLTEITKHHISGKENSRVIFMVPKTALAHQQYLFLNRYLNCGLSFIIGETTPLSPPGQKIKENQVIVLTPQVLINELKRKSEESFVSFKDISLLLFDECHHTTKKHPYREIMNMLLDFQASTPNANQIQIIGVTASPGVGKARDRVKVTENLLNLLANMNIMVAPSIVEKHINELNKHQNIIKEYIRQIQTESEFGKSVMDVMETIENKVKELNRKNDALHLNKSPMDKSKQSYENWTSSLVQFGKLHMRDQDAARILITYAEHLKMYNCLLQLKDLVPNAMDHTNKMVTFRNEGFENKKLLEQNQELIMQANNIRVPMLECLSELLRGEFDKNKDARCIIFVKRKLTARSLEECFANDDKLAFLNAKFMIGAHDSDAIEPDAMTKVAQQQIVGLFHEGKVKVIIATSVAEEGLNIPKCNLVVMYNYVTGEVGTVQRMGRIRAADGRAILLTCMDSKHVYMEQNNKICAMASDQAIADVRKIPVAELQQKIKNIQIKQREERKRKKEFALKANKNDPPSKWEILCGKCKNFLTTGDKLRHIDETHVVVKDPGFESKVTKVLKEQKKGPSVYGTADFNCNNPKCGIKVALEMVHEKSHYPVFSIKKIICRREGGRLVDPKKRSLLPFTIDRSIHESEDEKEYEKIVREDNMLTEELDLDENYTTEMLETINKTS